MDTQKIKEMIATWLNVFLLYPIKRKQFKDIHILSDQETVDKIVKNRLSVSRFGDGEISMIKGNSIGFQSKDEVLVSRMRDILSKTSEGHLNCIPHFFKTTKGHTWHVKKYYSSYAVAQGAFFRKMLQKGYTYGVAGFSRFYADYADKREKTIQAKIDKIRMIWQDRNIYLIEGVYTRCGVGNDLFDNAKSVQRIICPATNAFSIYPEILDQVKKTVPSSDDAIILCVLGPTATVLAYDLHLAGFQAIDLGHVDIEYEWFLKKTKGKEPVPGKAVNECGVNDVNQPITTEQYEREVIATVQKI